MSALLTIGEMATACGVSIRSLRHFEALGLLAPRRGENGRRAYGKDDALAVGRILMLQRAGFRLRQISELMTSPSPDPAGLVDGQILYIEQRVKALALALDQLRAARALLSDGVDLDLPGLCSIIRQGQNVMNTRNMKPVIDHYFTPDEQQKWHEAGSRFFSGEAPTEYEDRWVALIARIENAIARKESPDCPEAQRLLEDWLALLEPLEQVMGTEMMQKTGRMYAEMDQWQNADRQAPFSPEVFAFVQAAARAKHGRS